MSRYSPKKRPIENYQGSTGVGYLAWLESGRDKKLSRPFWTHCRDIFHQNTANYKGYVLMCIAKRGSISVESAEMIKVVVSDFVEYFEDKLFVENKSFYGSTIDPFTMWIKPSLFWYWSNMRRSFFTILLRAALEHGNKIASGKTSDSFETTLFQNQYVKSTKNATLMFLQGNTVPKVATLGNGGWVNDMHRLEGMIKEYIRPPKNKMLNDEIVCKDRALKKTSLKKDISLTVDSELKSEV